MPWTPSSFYQLPANRWLDDGDPEFVWYYDETLSEVLPASLLGLLDSGSLINVVYLGTWNSALGEIDPP